MINSKVNSKAIEVNMLAKEISTGLTKLSRSKPLLNVNMEIPKDKTTMSKTAITLESQIIKIKSIMLGSENTWLTAIEIRAKTVKIISEEPQALKMFLAWFFIDEKEGESSPKASLVLAVEPTTKPTALTKLISTG